VFKEPNNWDYEVASFSTPRIDVTTTGPYSKVSSIGLNQITASVDLTNLGVGTHTVPIHIIGAPAGVVCTSDITTIQVVIKRK
ncbi:MAG TPA: CdaR family protein, partial [Clostridia bacterium]|nr:CdaR family protein [Clostridia bacterium]